jgi:hypothetical protein
VIEFLEVCGYIWGQYMLQLDEIVLTHRRGCTIAPSRTECRYPRCRKDEYRLCGVWNSLPLRMHSASVFNGRSGGSNPPKDITHACTCLVRRRLAGPVHAVGPLQLDQILKSDERIAPPKVSSLARI